MRQFDGIKVLPKFARPRRYDLRLIPDLVAGKFTGTLSVDVEIVEKTRYIVLHSVGLSVFFLPFDTSTSKIECFDTDLFEKEELVVGEFTEYLPVGLGVLQLEFEGFINDTKGFCRSIYALNGEKQNVAFTQFEASGARRCFPCWDEPAYKAIFKITLEVPTDIVALSNMPILEEKINGNQKIVSYQESPTMSTYLVAIVVGSFHYVEHLTLEGIEVRIYCQVGKAEQGKFAAHVGAKTLDLFKEFFGVVYPLPKLDLIAIPDLAAGAKENYGLATYPETALLYDDQHSAAFTPMVDAASDASQLDQFVQLLGFHSSPQYRKQIMKAKPELQSMTLKPEFLRLLNSSKAMQQMNTLQQSLFSGYWNTTSRAREQTGATTGTGNNAEEMEICANDVVMNKHTGAVGVVSYDKLFVYPIAKLAAEEFREDDFFLVSRQFEHGDTIRSLTEGRKGVILGLEIKVDLASSTEEIVHRDIGTSRLERIRSFFVGDYVIWKSWVGRIESLELAITVKFEDRSRLTFYDPDPESLEPIFTNAAEEATDMPYYRGQTVVRKEYYNGDETGRVVRHGVNVLEINWFHTFEPGKREPDKRLRYNDVDRLHNSFSHVAWTVGDRCIMEEEDFVVSKVRTAVKVQWQDGMVEEVDSREVVPLEGKNEWFSGDFVSKANERSVGGFVRMVANGVAWVKWFGEQEKQPEILYEVELTRHPSHKFKLTNLVARVRSEEEENEGYRLRGFVIGLSDGLVRVEWDDQEITTVNPSDIKRLTYRDELDDPSSEDVVSSDDDDDVDDSSSENVSRDDDVVSTDYDEDMDG